MAGCFVHPADPAATHDPSVCDNARLPPAHHLWFRKSRSADSGPRSLAGAQSDFRPACSLGSPKTERASAADTGKFAPTLEDPSQVSCPCRRLRIPTRYLGCEDWSPRRGHANTARMVGARMSFDLQRKWQGRPGAYPQVCLVTGRCRRLLLWRREANSRWLSWRMRTRVRHGRGMSPSLTWTAATRQAAAGTTAAVRGRHLRLLMQCNLGLQPGAARRPSTSSLRTVCILLA